MSGVISLAHKRAERDWRATQDLTQVITCHLPRHHNAAAVFVASKLFPFSSVLADKSSGVNHFGEDLFDKALVQSVGSFAGETGTELKIAAYMPVVGQPVELYSPYDVALIDARDPQPSLMHYEVFNARHDGRGVRVVIRREMAALAPEAYRRIVLSTARLAAQKPLWTRLVDGVKSLFRRPKKPQAKAVIVALS